MKGPITLAEFLPMKSPCRNCEYENRDKEVFPPCVTCRKIKVFQTYLAASMFAIDHDISASQNNPCKVNVKLPDSPEPGTIEKISPLNPRLCVVCKQVRVYLGNKVCSSCRKKDETCFLCGDTGTYCRGMCFNCYLIGKDERRKAS